MESSTNIEKFLKHIVSYPITSKTFAIRVYAKSGPTTPSRKINLRTYKKEIDEEWTIFWFSSYEKLKDSDIQILEKKYEIQKVVVYSYHIEIEKVDHFHMPVFRKGHSQIVTKLFNQWLQLSYNPKSIAKEITISDYKLHSKEETEGRLIL